MEAKRKKKLTKAGKLHKNQQVPSNKNQNESYLYTTIQQGTSSHVVTVADWLKDYKDDKSTAFLELVQMIFNSCGCLRELTMEMFSHSDAAYVVNTMSNGFSLEPDNMYPMTNPGNQGKKFSNNLGDFFQELISQTKNSILFDGFLMRKLIDVLTCLTTSSIRAFRHAATFIILKLKTALVDVFIELLQRKSVTNKQLETARAMDKSATYNHIEMLEIQLKEYNENEAEISQTLRLLMVCFVQRIRDVMPEIRVLAITELCIWVMRLPESFHSLLKYIRYALHDPYGQVRYSALQTLKLLVDQDSLKLMLSPLLNMVKSRLIDMTLDKELNADILALGILTTIKNSHSETVALTLEDCKSVCGCMYSKHRPNARAAGLFFLACNQVFHEDQSSTDEEDENDASNDDSYAGKGKAFFKNLTAFHLRSKLEDPKTVGLLVDALIGMTPFLTDWAAMSNLLLKVLTENQQYVLVNILVHSVKQAVTGEPPLGRLHSKKQQTSKEKKQCNKERARMTQYFIDILPKLLKVHQGDSRKLAHLLSIALQMDLKMYMTLQKINAIKSLLKTVAKIAVGSTNDDELEMCAQVFLNFQPLGDQHTDQYIEIVIEHVVHAFNEAYNDWKNEEENITEEETHQLIACIRRVAIISSAFPLFKNMKFEHFAEILTDATEKRYTFILETYVYAVQAYYFYLLHSLNAAYTSTVDESVKRFLVILKQLLSDPSVDVKLKTMAFNAVCDTLLINQVRSETDAFIRYLHTIRNFLKQSMMTPKKEGAKDWSKTKLLMAYWRLLLNDIAPPSFAHVYFDNFHQMNEVYRESINDLFTSLWQSDKESCITLIISGLKALLLQYLHTPEGCDRLSGRFTKIMEVTKHAVGWLNLGKSNTAPFSSQLLQILKTKLPWDMDSEQMPFFEMMAQFSTKLVNKDKAKLLQEVNANLPEKPHISLQVFINSLSGNTMPGLGNKPRASDVHTKSGKQLKPRKTRRLEPLEIVIIPRRGPGKQVSPSLAPFTCASSTPRKPQANSTQLEIESGPFNNTDISRLSAIELSSDTTSIVQSSSRIEEEMDFVESTVPTNRLNVSSDKCSAKGTPKGNKAVPAAVRRVVRRGHRKSSIDSFNPLTPLLEEPHHKKDRSVKISEHKEDSACVSRASSLEASEEEPDHSMSDVNTETFSYLKNKTQSNCSSKAPSLTSSNIRELLLNDLIPQSQGNVPNPISESSPPSSLKTGKSGYSKHGSTITQPNLRKDNTHMQKTSSKAIVEAEESNNSMDGNSSPIASFLRQSKHLIDGSVNRLSRSCSVTSSNLGKMLVDDDLSDNIPDNHDSSDPVSGPSSPELENDSDHSRDKEDDGSIIVPQIKKKDKAYVPKTITKDKVRVATKIDAEESDHSMDTGGKANSLTSSGLKDLLRQSKHSNDGSVNRPSRSCSVTSSNLGKMLVDDDLSDNIPDNHDSSDPVSGPSSPELENDSDHSRDKEDDGSIIVPQIKKKDKAYVPKTITKDKVRVATKIDAEESDHSMDTVGKANSLTSSGLKDLLRQSKHSNDGSVNRPSRSCSVTSSNLGKMLLDDDISDNIPNVRDSTNPVSRPSSPESAMEIESDHSWDEEDNEFIIVPQIKKKDKAHVPKTITKDKVRVATKIDAEESDHSMDTGGKANSLTSSGLKDLLRQSKHSNDGSVNHPSRSCSVTSSNLGKMLLDDDLSDNIPNVRDSTNPVSRPSSPESAMEIESDHSWDEEDNEFIIVPQIKKKDKAHVPKTITKDKVRVATKIDAEESDHSMDTGGKANSLTSSGLKDLLRQSKHSNDGSVNRLSRSCSVTSSNLGKMLVDDDLSANIPDKHDSTDPVSRPSSPESAMEVESDYSRDEGDNVSKIIPRKDKARLQGASSIASTISENESDHSIDTGGKVSSITSNRLKDFLRQSKHSNDGSVNNAYGKTCSMTSSNLGDLLAGDQEVTNLGTRPSSPVSMIENSANNSNDGTINNIEAEDSDNLSIASSLMSCWQKGYDHLSDDLNITTEGCEASKQLVIPNEDELCDADESVDNIGSRASSVRSNCSSLLRQACIDVFGDDSDSALEEPVVSITADVNTSNDLEDIHDQENKRTNSEKLSNLVMSNKKKKTTEKVNTASLFGNDEEQTPSHSSSEKSGKLVMKNKKKETIGKVNTASLVGNDEKPSPSHTSSEKSSNLVMKNKKKGTIKKVNMASLFGNDEEPNPSHTSSEKSSKLVMKNKKKKTIGKVNTASLVGNDEKPSPSHTSSEKSSRLVMKNKKKETIGKVNTASLFGNDEEPSPSQATSLTVSSPAFSVSTVASRGGVRKATQYTQRHANEDDSSEDTDALISSLID